MTNQSKSDGVTNHAVSDPAICTYIERMTSPTVTELQRRLEPVTRDSFLDEAGTPAANRGPRERQRSTMTTKTMTIRTNTRGALRKLVARRGKRALAALLPIMIAGAGAPAAQAAGPFEIRPQHTDMCLEVPFGSHEIGVALVQNGCNKQPYQRFEFVPLANGYYKILPAHTSRKCLDVAGRNTSPGTKIQQWWCESVPNQEFALRYVGSDNRGSYYNLLPRHSRRENMCVSIAAGSTSVGARVEQLECVGPLGSPHQRFRLAWP
jgi:hypothetical protein